MQRESRKRERKHLPGVVDTAAPLTLTSHLLTPCNYWHHHHTAYRSWALQTAIYAVA